jgi:phosphoribosylamine---glycine ligase
VLMMRFQGDLLAVMLATAEGRLALLGDVAFSDDTAMTVVLAAAGYPGTPKAGGAIHGIDAAEATGAIVFQAGTKQSGDTLVASGGRVLAVTATGPDIRAARDAAYRGVDAIDFADGFCRRDIGWRALGR